MVESIANTDKSGYSFQDLSIMLFGCYQDRCRGLFYRAAGDMVESPHLPQVHKPRFVCLEDGRNSIGHPGLRRELSRGTGL